MHGNAISTYYDDYANRWDAMRNHVNHVATSTLPKMYIPYMQPQNGHIIFQRTIIFQIAFLAFHLKLGCGVFPGATKGGE